MTVPDGYYKGEVKFGGEYIFEEGTNRKVSMNYHEFDYPNVKLGANYYELTMYNGFFVPKNQPSHIMPKDQAEAEGVSRCSGATREEFEVLKAIAEFHDMEPPDPSIVDKDTPQQILTEELENNDEDDDDGTNPYRIK